MPTDIELFQLIADRDEAALMTLYQRYAGLVKGMAYRVLQDDSQAEEITQDTFLKVWRQPERWDASAGKVSTWLMAITRNAAIDRLRAEKRRPIYASKTTDAVAGELYHDSVADDPLWHDGQLLRQYLASLSAEQRQLIELAFFQGMTHSELAEALDLPLGTVKTRLRRGLQRLRAMWKENERATQ